MLYLFHNMGIKEAGMVFSCVEGIAMHSVGTNLSHPCRQIGMLEIVENVFHIHRTCSIGAKDVINRSLQRHMKIGEQLQRIFRMSRNCIEKC